MSSLALMRWLESTPERYDAGMHWMTLGRVHAVLDAAAAAAAPRRGAEILEIGCGTGALTKRLVARGARVTALDSNPGMLEQLGTRVPEVAEGQVVVLERAAAEIDALPAQAFDAVAASFALSEMGRAERAFVLKQAAVRLRPEGALVLADELRPASLLARLVFRLLRGPQALFAWLVAGSASRPLDDLAAEVRSHGLIVESERRWLLGSLGVVVARHPERRP